MTEQELTPDERAKLMARIKKCLALSKSPEPHEAAAAMRQAQKLMDRLGVSAEQAMAPEIEDALVKTREGFGRCLYMNHLVWLIRKAFGVDAVQECNPGTAVRLNVRYIGPRGRVQLAEYTHRVVQRAVDEAWAEFLRVFPYKKSVGGARTAFRMGWLDKVSAQIEAMAITESEQKAIEAWEDAKYKGALTTNENRQVKLDPFIHYAGQSAADDFTLHRPMTDEKLKLENKSDATEAEN